MAGAKDKSSDRSIYRRFMRRKGLAAFSVRHLETDLFIQASKDLSREVSSWVVEARTAIETYAGAHPGFFGAVQPLKEDPFAHEVVRAMLSAGAAAGVGPMAAVAGAIAQLVCNRIVALTGGEAVVENGGDIALYLKDEMVSGIWAGRGSPFSARVGIRLLPGSKEGAFMAVCTSSGTIGHSLSLGRADAAVAVAADAALADAAATGAGNLVASKSEIEKGLEYLSKIPGITGGVIIKGDQIGAWGQIELVPL